MTYNRICKVRAKTVSLVEQERPILLKYPTSVQLVIVFCPFLVAIELSAFTRFAICVDPFDIFFIFSWYDLMLIL